MKKIFKREIDKLQSKIDELHGECQYWQLVILAYKYSIKEAIKICEPKRAGHYSKDQARMLKHIDFLKESFDEGLYKNLGVYDYFKNKLKEKIKQLKETKTELYQASKKLNNKY